MANSEDQSSVTAENGGTSSKSQRRRGTLAKHEQRLYGEKCTAQNAIKK